MQSTESFQEDMYKVLDSVEPGDSHSHRVRWDLRHGIPWGKKDKPREFRARAAPNHVGLIEFHYHDLIIILSWVVNPPRLRPGRPEYLGAEKAPNALVRGRKTRQPFHRATRTDRLTCHRAFSVLPRRNNTQCAYGVSSTWMVRLISTECSVLWRTMNGSLRRRNRPGS